MWPVNEAEDGVEQSKQDELPVQQLVDAPLPAQQQPVETQEGGVGYFTGISDGHPETATWIHRALTLPLASHDSYFLFT